MNLHRAGKMSDWNRRPRSEWNVFQKVAGATHGVITPGNFLTILGGTFVAAGLVDVYHGKTRRGVWKIGLGRMIDIADGIAADKTGTKSPLGEALDATVDKIAMAGILAVFYKKGIISRQTALHIGAQNLANTAITATAKMLDLDIHPSKQGKHTMLLQGMAVGLNGLGQAAYEEGDWYKANQLRLCADICEIGAAGKGIAATAGYIQELREQRAAA